MRESLLKQELAKVEREICTHGETFSFYRYKKNEYEEDTEEKEVVCDAPGLFHQTKSYVSRSVSDANVTETKAQPMILFVLDDVLKVSPGDMIDFSGRTYTVSGKNDVNQYGALCDVSLEEVVTDGVQG